MIARRKTYRTQHPPEIIALRYRNCPECGSDKIEKWKGVSCRCRCCGHIMTSGNGFAPSPAQIRAGMEVIKQSPDFLRRNPQSVLEPNRSSAATSLVDVLLRLFDDRDGSDDESALVSSE